MSSIWEQKQPVWIKNFQIFVAEIFLITCRYTWLILWGKKSKWFTRPIFQKNFLTRPLLGIIFQILETQTSEEICEHIIVVGCWQGHSYRWLLYTYFLSLRFQELVHFWHFCGVDKNLSFGAKKILILTNFCW